MVGAARIGTWIDEIVFVVEDSQPQGIARIAAGEANLFTYSIDGAHAPLLEANNMAVELAYGGTRELLLNHQLYFDDGRFNPFGDDVICVAFQQLIDRDYIVSLWGGYGFPMYSSPLSVVDPIYTDIIATTRATELLFQFNEQKAIDAIKARLEELGAVIGADGYYEMDGARIEVIGAIRTEDVRLQVGDYVADQLGKCDIYVDRVYGTSPDLSPLWAGAPMGDGAFSYYTGGWGRSGISLENVWSFAQHYTDLGLPWPLYTGYTPELVGQEFYDAAEVALTGTYATVQERLDAFKTCEASIQFDNAWHLWLIQLVNLWYLPDNMGIANDLAAGLFGWWWPYTMRFIDADGAPVVGGSVTALNQSFLVEPWNPVHGSNWAYDLLISRATVDLPSYTNPFTGLGESHWVESVDVVVTEGLPVRINAATNWVTLSFVDEVVVPEDCWYDFDSTTNSWITTGEAFPDGATTDKKVTVTFPSELWTYKWHDGSTFSIADCLLELLIGGYESKNPESPNHDPAEVAAFAPNLENIKGFRIITEDPFVFEWYSDGIALDAESIAGGIADNIWPYWGQGGGPWHTVALGMMTDAAGTGAFSKAKSTAAGVDMISYVDGPQLQLLAENLATAQLTNFIPYAEFLGDYITEGEAVERYANAAAFLATYGHLWIGTGPLYVESFDTLASVVVMKRFTDYPFDLDRYLRFSDPKIAEVSISGPDTVTIGEAASFDVAIQFQGEAYPLNELKVLTYLVINSEGEIAFSGFGEFTANGAGIVNLSVEETGALTEGSSRLEVVVTVTPNMLPANAAVSFVAL